MNKVRFITPCVFFITGFWVVMLFLILTSVNLYASNEYPPLQSVLEPFPESNTGMVTIYPYEKTSAQNVDGSKFSIWVPAGTRSVYLSMGTGRQSTLNVSSDIPEIGEFEMNFGRGGYDSLKRTVIETFIEWDEDASGKWVFFEFSNGATPSYYYSRYRNINTDHPNYSKPPQEHPVPTQPTTPPESDPENDNGGNAEEPDNGNDNGDDTGNDRPDDDDTNGYVPPSNPFEGIGTDPGRGFDRDRQDPSDDRKTGVELESQKGYQRAMDRIQNISSAELSEDSYLKPRLRLNDHDLVPSGSNGNINAYGYAMLELKDQEAGHFFVVVPDSLGRLSLMPLAEVGVRPYTRQIQIDVEDDTWQSDAFQIVQEFFIEHEINGLQELINWNDEGIDVIFYIGFAPDGDMEKFQGAAFQIVQ